MRLVDVDAANIKDIECGWSCSTDLWAVEEWLNNLPTIEAKPVVHGEWEKVCDEKDWRCTACGSVFCFPVGDPIRNKDNYCSHCGADMRGKT